MNPVSHAVLDQDAQLGELLYFPIATAKHPYRRGRIHIQPRSMAELFHVADVAKVYQLWLTKRWVDAHQVESLDSWQLCRVEDQRQSLAIVAPSRDERRRLAGLADADGAQLVQTVMLFESALGEHFTATPGYVAESLLRADLRRRALHTVAGSMPEVLLKRPTAAPVAWMRPLEPDEAARTWCVAVDKHAAYLMAMGQVELGLGKPEHVVEPLFDRHLAGVWRVRTRELGGLLFDPSGEAPRRASDGWRWLPTPAVRAADELGMLEQIAEAYVWRRHSRVLEHWSNRVRTARSMLLSHGDSEAARRALWLLKRVYTSLVGRLRMQREDVLYRPDWYDALIAEARYALWHNAQKCGSLPFAALVDCLYFAVDSPEPPEGLRVGPNVGQFELKAAVRLDQVGDARTVGDLARHVLEATRK